MPRRSSFVFLIAFLAAGLAAVPLYVDYRARVEDLNARQHARRTSAVANAAVDLESGLERLQELALLFTEEQEAALTRLYHEPQSPELLRTVERKVGAYFPENLTFTIADEQGEPVPGESGHAIGKRCRSDLAGFAATGVDKSRAYTPYIHFNPVGEGYGRHFDVMAPWFNSARGVFFVSVSGDFLLERLERHESDGFHLLLLRSDRPDRVELETGAGIVSEPKVRSLTDAERNAISEGRPVRGSLWRIAALPDAARLEAETGALLRSAVGKWIVTLAIIAAMAGLWSFDASRRRKLAAMNASLNDEIVARERSEVALVRLTNYDPLTGLPNRKSLEEFLSRALASAAKTGHMAAVLFFDFDRFKEFNDSLGHGYGDVLLKEAAHRLNALLPEEDMLARWGGDEFVVVMQQVRDENEVAHVANRFLKAMREPIAMHHREVTITISIGIATYPDAGSSAEAMLKNADLAMYRAKHQGRNQFRFFNQEMDDLANERLKLETEIREAIGRREFVPFYQPKMDLDSGVITGCEALMRWRHPERGLLAPGDFIDTLEEIGLIVEVGDALRKRVCHDLRAWKEQGLNIGVVSVNLSGKEFSGQTLIDGMFGELSACGLEAPLLQIEVTETCLMESTADSLAKLHALKHMGFTLAIDDFGTGYSSLSYLQRFPVDVLKIDLSFVRDCVTNPGNQEIIRTICTLAHSLNLDVVAEGVESIAQLELLRGFGCDEVQGYQIGRAMSFEDYGEFIRKRFQGPIARDRAL